MKKVISVLFMTALILSNFSACTALSEPSGNADATNSQPQTNSGNNAPDSAATTQNSTSADELSPAQDPPPSNVDIYKEYRVQCEEAIAKNKELLAAYTLFKEGDTSSVPYYEYHIIDKQVIYDDPKVSPDSSFDVDERVFDNAKRFGEDPDECHFSGIKIGTSKQELIDKLGLPDSIVIVFSSYRECPAFRFNYKGVEYFFAENDETVFKIDIQKFQWIYAPRNIRIGDRFEDVLAKFPQEKDYKADPEGYFYGEYGYQNSSGFAIHNHIGLYNGSVVYRIYFENGSVTRIELFCPVD